MLRIFSVCACLWNIASRVSFTSVYCCYKLELKNEMNSTQILKHCKYFIDFFTKKFINKTNVSFSSCTSGMLSSYGTEVLSTSDLINLQLTRIYKTILCSNKEHVIRRPLTHVQEIMIHSCSWYDVVIWTCIFLCLSWPEYYFKLRATLFLYQMEITFTQAVILVQVKEKDRKPYGLKTR